MYALTAGVKLAQGDTAISAAPRVSKFPPGKLGRQQRAPLAAGHELQLPDSTGEPDLSLFRFFLPLPILFHVCGESSSSGGVRPN